jgi:serine/threonine-protein kinase
MAADEQRRPDLAETARLPAQPGVAPTGGTPGGVRPAASPAFNQGDVLRVVPDGAEPSRTTGQSASRQPSSAGESGPSVSGGSTGPALRTSEEVLQEVAKSASNVDSIIGRLVIDQGFATPEELQRCLDLARAMEANQRSIADLLVDNEYITRRQMERLREQAAAEKSGKSIPGYKIISELGKGAMAKVFKAKQISLDRMVAIKVLPKRFNTNKQFIERFYAEGRAAAALNHPNIVQAYDVGKSGDIYYFVMEYVDGATVYDEIAKRKRVPEDEALDIVVQVGEALQHAHERGLIHRDVKPKNIMFTKGGVVKLADMGLARAISDKEAAEAEQGKAFGTPYYISPEQIRGEKEIGPPADIYSLGATLYHMVTGQVPFDGKDPTAVMRKHLKGELVAPDHVYQKLSAGISEVIEMMMAKDPKARYQSCKDLLIDLRAVRSKQHPPLAHKDFGALDSAKLLQEEAKAATAPTPATPATQAGKLSIRPWLFWTLVGLALLNIPVGLFALLR